MYTALRMTKMTSDDDDGEGPVTLLNLKYAIYLWATVNAVGILLLVPLQYYTILSYLNLQENLMISISTL